jgi:hypothetical protein
LSVINYVSEYWIARSSRAMTAVEEIFDNNNAIYEMASRPDTR